MNKLSNPSLHPSVASKKCPWGKIFVNRIIDSNDPVNGLDPLGLQSGGIYQPWSNPGNNYGKPSEDFADKGFSVKFFSFGGYAGVGFKVSGILAAKAKKCDVLKGNGFDGSVNISASAGFGIGAKVDVMGMGLGFTFSNDVANTEASMSFGLDYKNQVYGKACYDVVDLPEGVYSTEAALGPIAISAEVKNQLVVRFCVEPKKVGVKLAALVCDKSGAALNMTVIGGEKGADGVKQNGTYSKSITPGTCTPIGSNFFNFN